MNKEELLKTVTSYGIVPVVVIEDENNAEGLGKALVNGGIPVAEVTFRTTAAAKAIKIMSQKVPGIIVGAGTIHTPQQAEKAVESGAKFIVTPGFSKETVKWCIDNDIPVLPGVTSPSNIEEAMSLGLTTLKFFPSEAYGGIKTLKALSGPYSNIKFMPTGGINPNNIADYLKCSNIAACGGSWMVPKNLVEEQKFDEISDLCREAINSAFGFKLLHVGINNENKDEGYKNAKLLSTLFGLKINELEGAYFAGSIFEVLKSNFRGKNGHIAIETTCIERAYEYFKTIGVEFDEKSKGYDENNKLVVIYFKNDIAGFAIHLRRKD